MTAVYGRSRSGKTTYVRELLKGRSRVVVFDPKDEYKSLRGYRSVGPSKNEADLVAAVRRKAFKVAYVPEAMNEPEQLHRVATVVMAAAQDGGPLTFVVDEMHLGFPSAALPRRWGGFAKLISIGLGYGIDLVGVSQRPAEIGSRFRGNSSRVVFFALGFGEPDRQAARGLIGAAWAERLTGLEPHHYVICDENGPREGRNKLAGKPPPRV